MDHRSIGKLLQQRSPDDWQVENRVREGEFEVEGYISELWPFGAG